MSSLFLLYLLFYLCFSFFTFSYFLLLFTFFCCSRSSLYVCTFFSISFLNISQRDFEPNKKRAKAVLKNSLILFIVVCLVGVMFFLVKLFQFSHWMSTFYISHPSNSGTQCASGRSFSPSLAFPFTHLLSHIIGLLKCLFSIPFLSNRSSYSAIALTIFRS